MGWAGLEAAACCSSAKRRGDDPRQRTVISQAAFFYFDDDDTCTYIIKVISDIYITRQKKNMLRRNPTRIELKQEDVDEFEKRMQRPESKRKDSSSDSRAYQEYLRKREAEGKSRVMGSGSR